MRRSNSLLAAFVAALSLLAAAPSWGAIGTPLSLGGANNAASVQTLPLSTGASSPAGALIFVAVSTTSGGGTPSVTDTAGNTYVQIGSTLNFGLAGKHTLFYAANAAALSIGSTITATWVGDAKPVIIAFSVTGVATSSPVDVVTAATTAGSGTAVTPAISTGLLSQPDELVIGYTGVDGNPGTLTPSGGFAYLSKSGAGGNNETWLEYQVVSSTGGVSAGPTWSPNSRAWGSLIITFKGDGGGGGAPAAPKRTLVLGVGE